MKTLFITAGESVCSQEWRDYPLSGAIFAPQVAVAGMKEKAVLLNVRQVHRHDVFAGIAAKHFH